TSFIRSYVSRSLPKKHRHWADEIARAVILNARNHNMDPLFLLAVIQNESSFNPEARGRHGEIGLIQMRRRTALDVARRLNIPTNFDLTNPLTNIKIGAAYMAQ